MTVRNAIEARRTAPAPVPADNALIEAAVTRHRAVLDRILPQYLNREQFEATALQAIQSSPDLVKCFATVEGETSVLAGIVQAASVGLRIDPIVKEAWLIPRTKWKKRGNQWIEGPTLATLQLDYRGVMKLARRDPGVDQILGDVVRDGDEFDWWRDLDGEHLTHRVVGPSDRALTHAYAIVRYSNGRSLAVVLDRVEIERRRAVSQSWKKEEEKAEGARSGFWVDWEDRMWRKTAIHAIRSNLDLAPDVARALNADGRALTFADNDTGVGWIDADEDDTPELEAGPAATPDPAPEPDRAEPPADEAPPMAAAPRRQAKAKSSTPVEGATTEADLKAWCKSIGLSQGDAIRAVREQLGHAHESLADVAADPHAVADLKDWAAQP